MLKEKDLIQLNPLKDEIAMIEEEIAELEEELEELNEKIIYVSPMHPLEENSIMMPDAIHIGPAKTGVNKDQIINFIIKLEDERKELSNKILSLKVEKLEKEAEINKTLKNIENIRDEKLRQIIKLKHLDGHTWEYIGQKVYLSRQGAYKKYKEWFTKVAKK